MRPDPLEDWEAFERLPPEAQNAELFRLLDDMVARLNAAETILRSYASTARPMAIIIWLSGFVLGVMVAKVVWHIA